MTDLIKQITGDLQQQIDSFQPQISISDIGTVVEAGDGIARVHGLANVRAQELVQFSNGVIGTAFNLEKESVGVIVMGDYSGITEGMIVRGMNRIVARPPICTSHGDPEIWSGVATFVNRFRARRMWQPSSIEMPTSRSA